MPVKFGTVVFEKSAKLLSVPYFFAISKARVLDKNAQSGLKHHLPSVSGRMFSPLPRETNYSQHVGIKTVFVRRSFLWPTLPHFLRFIVFFLQQCLEKVLKDDQIKNGSLL